MVCIHLWAAVTCDKCSLVSCILSLNMLYLCLNLTETHSATVFYVISKFSVVFLITSGLFQMSYFHAFPMRLFYVCHLLSCASFRDSFIYLCGLHRIHLSVCILDFFVASKFSLVPVFTCGPPVLPRFLPLPPVFL